MKLRARQSSDHWIGFVHCVLRFGPVGPLKNADFVMNQVFWIGVYPGITPAMIEYMVESLQSLASAGVQAGV